MALARFYDVSLDWIASPDGFVEVGSARARDEREALLLDAFRRLPEEEADPLLQMLLSRVKEQRRR